MSDVFKNYVLLNSDGLVVSELKQLIGFAVPEGYVEDNGLYEKKIIPPSSVSPYQMREWLRINGHLETVKNFINFQQDKDLREKYQSKFQFAGTIERNDPLVSIIINLLNLTEDQTDKAFEEASKII